MTHAASSRRPAWLAPELYLILAVGAAIYGSRISALTIRGEEPRRARVAYEMMESGNWFVPTQQGRLFADRPPLGAWLMSASTQLCGGRMSTFAVRLPTIVATILTAVAVWLYTRRFLSPAGAVAAACIFLSFGQVLQLGRVAECEAVFISLVATALLGWHALYSDGRRPWIVWTWGYAWAALACLSKGPQGPIYFAAAVGAYLLLRRDWRTLFAPGHYAGLAVFAAIFGAWLVPYWLQTDLEAVRRLLFGTVTQRLGDDGSLLRHLVAYPWHILGCLLPWSPLLFRFAFPSFRAELRTNSQPQHDAVVFCATAVAATFPSVWFAFGATGRHFMSLYPCFAVLAAVVVDRSWQAARSTSLGRGWGLFIYSIAGLALAAGLTVTVAPWLTGDWADYLRQRPSFTLVFALSALATAVAAGYSLRYQNGMQRSFGVVAATCFLGLAYAGGIVNSQIADAVDTPGSVAALKKTLPAGVKIVSLGEIDPLFAYHYRDTIPVVAWPKTASEVTPEVEYFAFVEPTDGPARIPFAWQPVSTVSCERNQTATPRRLVRIGRRIEGPDVGAPAQVATRSEIDR
jgi:4-amino-4-deoxy-L-arabinose transferase-like glycosyltransferase